MSKKTTNWFMVPVVAVLTAGMTACSGGGDQATEPVSKPPEPTKEAVKEPVKAPVKEAPPEPVELILYSTSGDSEASINERFVNPVIKKYPHIKLKYLRSAKDAGTTLPDLLAAGKKIDIFYHGRGSFESTLTQYHLQSDMSDLIKKHDVDISDLEPSSVDSIKNFGKGKIYGLPISLNSLVLYFNKALFDKFGVPYPKDGMTWDETIEIGKKMTRQDSGKSYLGFGSVTTQVLRWNPFSIPLVDPKTEKPTINTDDRWKTIIQTVHLNAPMVEGFKTGGNVIPGYKGFFQDMNLAMMLYTAAVPTSLKKELEPIDWDMVSPPTFKELPGRGSQASPVYFGITSLSEKRDAAMQVIKYWTSTEYQTRNSRTGGVMASQAPEVVKVRGKDTAFPDKNWNAATYYKFAPLSPVDDYSDSVVSIHTRKLKELIAGTMDLNTYLRTVEEEATKVIERIKSQKSQK